MFEQIANIFQALISLFPHLHVVRATHNGVKFKNGKTLCVLKPGLHIYWPLVSEIEDVSIVRDSLNVDPQLLTTDNDIAFIASAVLEYRVDRPLIAVGMTTDYEDEICNVACAAVAQTLSGKPWGRLMHLFSEGDLDRSLKSFAQDRLGPYGVAVEDARLTELARCDGRKHFGIPDREAIDG